MTLKIRQHLLQGTPKTPTQKYNGKHIIIIHNTATHGATSANEDAYFHRTWYNIQSFVHAFVDWTGDAVEHQEVGNIAWGAGNVNTYAWLQVEQCIGTHEQNRLSAEYTAQYVAEKIKQSGLKFEDFQLLSHADASVQFGGTDHMDTVEGVGWLDFVNRVKQLTTKATVDTNKSTGEAPDAGVFHLNYDIKARVGGPDTKNKQAYVFKKGDSIKYDRRLFAGGYEWISQKRATGGYWYVPVRELNTNTYWGTFKKG